MGLLLLLLLLPRTARQLPRAASAAGHPPLLKSERHTCRFPAWQGLVEVGDLIVAVNGTDVSRGPATWHAAAESAVGDVRLIVRKLKVRDPAADGRVSPRSSELLAREIERAESDASLAISKAIESSVPPAPLAAAPSARDVAMKGGVADVALAAGEEAYGAQDDAHDGAPDDALDGGADEGPSAEDALVHAPGAARPEDKVRSSEAAAKAVANLEHIAAVEHHVEDDEEHQEMIVEAFHKVMADG